MDNNEALLLRAEIVSDELMFSATKAKMQGNEKISLTVENAKYSSETLDLLRAAITESQRRERAAVEDIPKTCEMCAKAKMNNGAGMLCEWLDDCNQVEGDHWEWRGPQEAGEVQNGD